MLQEGSFSLPPLCLLRDEREWRKRRRAIKSKKKRRKRWRRRKETPHLAGILPCNSCCYILFVCFWGTLRTSSPSLSPSSLPTVPLPSVSPFLPRVRPHLDPGIWVRLYVYNLLRRRAHRGYLGYPRTSFVGCTIRKSNYTPVPFPGGRLFFSEQASESLIKEDGSRNIGRLARNVQDLFLLISHFDSFWLSLVLIVEKWCLRFSLQVNF